MLLCSLAELLRRRLRTQLLLEVVKRLDGLLLRARNHRLAVATGTTAILVLDENVARADGILRVRHTAGLRRCRLVRLCLAQQRATRKVTGLLFRHAFWELPHRHLRVWVVKVRQLARVAEANFPGHRCERSHRTVLNSRLTVRTALTKHVSGERRSSAGCLCAAMWHALG